MLTMEQVKYIKKLFNNQGLSISEIIKKTGNSYETVRKYIDMEDFNERKGERKKKETKIDPVKEIIDGWLTNDLTSPRKQRHTAKHIYERLLKEHDGLYKGRYRTIATYVTKRKRELRTDNKGYLPLDHHPYEAQVDFGEAIFTEHGKEIKGKYLVMTFPRSNSGYFQLFKGENQQCLFTGMKNIFERLDCVPKEIWFDNMSTAVATVKKEGKRVLAKGFEKFALHYNFESKFCNPASGNEKGSVENKVGYFRRNYLVPIPEINDLNKFNLDLLEISEKDMERKHYKSENTIKDLFAEDKKTMLKLNSTPFEVCRFESVKANKYGKVQLDKKTYSVSPDYALKRLIIKATYEKVIILDLDYKVIITHTRLYGGKQESMNWLPYLHLMAQRPRAIMSTQFYNELPLNWKDYIGDLEFISKGEAIKTLHKMLITHDISFAEDVLKYNLEQGKKDLKSLLTQYYSMTKDDSEKDNPIQLSESIPKQVELKVNMQNYDKFMQVGAQK